jgi:hypothetical protein
LGRRRSLPGEVRRSLPIAGLWIERARTPDASFIENGSESALLAILDATGTPPPSPRARKSKLVAAVSGPPKTGARMPNLLRDLREQTSDGAPAAEVR